MPEEPVSSQPPVISTPPVEKILEFKKKKFLLVLGGSLIVTLILLIIAYQLGKASVQDASLEKETKVTTKSATPANVKKGSLGDEVETIKGIAVTLDSASVDKAYEKQKESQREYYEKNASQSAYLEDDYFNQSLVNLKIALRNKTSKSLTYSPTNFRLKDSENNQYTAGFEGQNKSLLDLNSKEVTRITVSYIVPTSEKTFKLVYENAEISFTLP